MQIITTEDVEFPKLVESLRGGTLVGRYWKDDRVQIVCATPQFLLVALGDNPEKIAIKPTLSISESEQLGRRLLAREQNRGNKVELEPRR